jgi:hypothetical protein
MDTKLKEQHGKTKNKVGRIRLSRKAEWMQQAMNFYAEIR